MEKIRVYELARDLDTNSKRLMEKLAEIDIIVKNHMSLLEESELEALYRHIGMKTKSQDAVQSDSSHPPHEPVKQTKSGQSGDKIMPAEGAAAAAGDIPAARGAAPSTENIAPIGKPAQAGVAPSKEKPPTSKVPPATGALPSGSPATEKQRAAIDKQQDKTTGRKPEASSTKKPEPSHARKDAKRAPMTGESGAARTPEPRMAQRDAPKEGRDNQGGARSARDTRNAPRIIRTTEINLDRSSREDRRDNTRQPATAAQPGSGRDGERSRRDRDRDRRRRDYDRSEYYRAPDSNSGLIAGFTRMTREESLKQLLEEAREQQKRSAVENEVNKQKMSPAGGEAAKTDRAARIDRLTRMEANVKTDISEPGSIDSTKTDAASSVDADAIETKRASGIHAGAADEASTVHGAEKTDDAAIADAYSTSSQSETSLKKKAHGGAPGAPDAPDAPGAPGDLGIQSDAALTHGTQTDAVALTQAAQGTQETQGPQATQAGVRFEQIDSEKENLADAGAAPADTKIVAGGKADAKSSRITASDAQTATDAAPSAAGAAPKQAVPAADKPRRAGEQQRTGEQHRTGEQQRTSERQRAGEQQRTGEQYRTGERQRAGAGRAQDGRSQPRASFDGRPYQQQDQSRAGQPRQQGRPQDGMRPQDGARQQDGAARRAGAYQHGQGGDARRTTGVYQQSQSGDTRRSTGAYQQGQGGAMRRDGRDGRDGRERQSSQGGYRQQTDDGRRQYAAQGNARGGAGAGAGAGASARSGAASMGDRRQSGDARRGGSYQQGQGGARSKSDFAKPGALSRSDETGSLRNEQKREYSVRDSAKEAKKDMRRESAKPAQQTNTRGRRFKPQVSIIGEKKGVQAFTDDEFIINEFYEATDESKRSRRQQRQRKMRRIEKYIPPRAILTSVTINENLTVKELAEALKKTASDVITKLMGLGMAATINEVIDFDTATLVASEFSIATEKAVVVNEEDILFDDTKLDEGLVPRPPVVVVMGHVDHGKTSLLDAIRKTNVISSEAGGITQHIGAYMVNINGRAITFLDTPGHEAFTSMRARGAMVTDIAILVVSAVDGIMPQTIEAINHAKAANVSLIVAINMIDREGANPDKVKQELTEHDILVEEWGGDVIAVPVSAKTGENIGQLLEMIILTADMLELTADPERQAKGTVIEAKLDRNRGPVATLLVQRGTLNVGDSFITGATIGRIRAMLDDKGASISKAGPSTPVEIIGLSEVPEAGEVFYVTTDDKVTKSLAEKRRQQHREDQLKATTRVTLDDLFSQIQEGKIKELNLIIKADVQGSVEAVRQSVEKLGNDEVRVNIIHSGVGAINESDVSLASVSSAIIIGFNVRPGGASVIEAADIMGIDVRLYTVIYNAIEDIEAALKGMLDPTYREVVLGHVEVRQIFRASGVGTIGGCYVLDGKIQRSNNVRILRDGIAIYDGRLASLRRFKDDAREVMQGFECGIAIERFNDIKENDIIEPYFMEEIPVV